MRIQESAVSRQEVPDPWYLVSWMDMESSKIANNKDWRQRTCKYLLDKDWYTEWVNETAPFKIPVLQGMKDDEVWQDERNKPFIDSVANFTFLGYPNTYTPAASEVFNSRLLSNCFTNIVTGSDPAEEIAKLQTDMQAVYDKEK